MLVQPPDRTTEKLVDKQMLNPPSDHGICRIQTTRYLKTIMFAHLQVALRMPFRNYTQRIICISFALLQDVTDGQSACHNFHHSLCIE